MTIKHEKIRNGATHEAAHAIARELLPTLGGVEFVSLTVDADGVLNGNVRVSPSKGERIFENIIAKLCGVVAEEVLLGTAREQALNAGHDDLLAVEKLLERFDPIDRRFFRVYGMQNACEFVLQHRQKIERLATELEQLGIVPGERVKEIASSC